MSQCVVLEVSINLFDDRMLAMGLIGCDRIQIACRKERVEAVRLEEGRLSFARFLVQFGDPPHDHLAEQDGSRVLSTGGVLIQTTAEPWRVPTSPPPPGEARLANVFGQTALQLARPNLALPSVYQHILASPGTDEMPRETWQSSRDEAAQRRKYESARKRLTKALTDRSTPVLAPNSVE